MSTQISLENFEEIYNETYNKTLKYIICKCFNLEDVNDLIQDTYLELYKILKKKKYIELDNYSNFIIGIAKKKIQKHYGIVYKIKTISIGNQSEDTYELTLPADLDLETELITKLNAEEVWKFIKRKDIKIVKVFYLYYCLDLKISQIAEELNMTESNVKNVLYRTIKDIKKNIKMEGDIDESKNGNG